MSAIRPLATIAILAALGVFLAMKINQGPIAPTASSDEAWDEAPAYGDAPAAAEAPAFGDAPTFGSTAPPSFPTPPPMPEATTAAPPAIPDLPPLPSLPGETPTAELTTAAPASGPTAVDASQLDLPDLPLPANIPTANYSDSAPPIPPADPPTQVPPQSAQLVDGQNSGQVPSLGTATPSYPIEPAPSTDSVATGSLSEAPRAVSPYGTDRYGAASSTSTPAFGAAAPVASSYASARPAIQAALDRDELKRAHLLLTQWYGDPNLSAEERSEVDRLLSQLAGTVIYSGEHRLEPPHQVQPGETLETIAEKYGTPWQLLAKINGIPSSDAVRPGQILKVVRGPFSAVVDVSDAEVYLTVEGRYAGRFPVQLDGLAASEGAWTVVTKGLRYQPGSPSADAQGYDKSLTLSTGQSFGGPTIEVGGIGGGSAATAAARAPAGRIDVAAADLNDLFDILSEGSKLTIQR